MRQRLSALLLCLGLCTTAVSASAAEQSQALIAADQLAQELKAGTDLVVIDFRNAKLPGGYIPGAVKLAHSEVMENRDGRKRMLVSQVQLEQALGAAGIDADDRVVVYDDKNSLWATRLWWSLKAYGHKDVAVLNGGLAAWNAAGLDTDLSASERPATEYRAKGLDTDYIADFSAVRAAQRSDQVQLLDARGPKDTDKGMIESATIVEWSETQNADGTFKSRAELEQLYSARGLDAAKGVINYCNSGIKASVNTFVLSELLGYVQVANYDGSMIDYRLSQQQLAAQ